MGNNETRMRYVQRTVRQWLRYYFRDNLKNHFTRYLCFFERIKRSFLFDLWVLTSGLRCCINEAYKHSPLMDIPYLICADLSIGCAFSGGPHRRKALLSSDAGLHICLCAMPRER